MYAQYTKVLGNFNLTTPSKAKHQPPLTLAPKPIGDPNSTNKIWQVSVN